MKYFKTKFIVTCSNTGARPDETTLVTARELCAALAGYAGYESFEDTEKSIDGYVQQNQLDESALTAAFSEFPMEGIHISYTTAVAEDKNWNEQWEKEGFEPIVFNDKCRIHDIYHKYDDCSHYLIDIEIDAKLAFGTGTHNTTKMIVNELLEMDIQGKRILDCGCGTGILSIIAAKCGAKDIVAYDIDEWSVNNTSHNAAINNVHNIIVKLGDVNILNNIDGTFDVVLANINRNILLNDMPAMATKMHPDTEYIISGFYSEDVPMLKEETEELGMKCLKQVSSDNWTLLKFIKE